MAVPNTTTFTLQNVTTEIYGDTNTGRNLSDCFVDATGTFDPSYVGDKSNLLNFRNYLHVDTITVVLNSVTIDTVLNKWGSSSTYTSSIPHSGTEGICYNATGSPTKEADTSYTLASFTSETIHNFSNVNYVWIPDTGTYYFRSWATVDSITYYSNQIIKVL